MVYNIVKDYSTVEWCILNYNNSESIIEEETTAASNDLAEDEDDDSDESVNARKVYAKARMFNYSSNHLIITLVI